MKLSAFNERRHTGILSKVYGSKDDRPRKSFDFSQNGWLITLFVIVSIVLAFTSCQAPIEDPSSHDFVIWNGERYASPRLFEPFKSQRLAFKASFDESARYDIDSAGVAEKNILMGFTDCGSLSNVNSADFAWRWINEHLEIYAQRYADGRSVEEYVGVVDLNQENRYEIDLTEGQYVFYLNGEQKAVFQRLSTCDAGGNYVLFPYFNQPKPAPHNIRVAIEILD